MTHNEFFELAIDPVDVPDRSLEPAIDEHRRECSECRDFERAFARNLRIGRSAPIDLPPEPPGLDERVMLAVRATIDARSRVARPRLVRPRLVLAAAALAGVLLGAFQLVDLSPPDENLTRARQVIEGRLEAARSLLLRGRKLEAREEAMEVEHDVHASPAQRQNAEEILQLLERH